MIYLKEYVAPPINLSEILRYMGAKEQSDELSTILKECQDEAMPKLLYRVCYTYADVTKCADGVSISNIKTNSLDLGRYLKDSKKTIVFAATIGIEMDRLIAKYSRISPAKALIFQAIGAERIEALCDVFCEEMAKEGFKKARFSPGYGDFLIDAQKDIFSLLDPSRKIGLSLTERLIMSPSKSVTAIIAEGDGCTENNCLSCNKNDCEYRRK